MLFIDIEALKEAKLKKNISYEKIANIIEQEYDRKLTRSAIYKVFIGENRRYSTAYMIAKVLGLDANKVVYICN